jgi:hypothetical protein
MNLRLAAANFHDFLQRNVRCCPYEPEPGRGADRFCLNAVGLVVLALLFALQMCGQAKSNRAAQTAPRDTIVDSNR